MTHSEGGGLLASKARLNLKVTHTFLLLRTSREASAVVELGGTDDASGTKSSDARAF